MHSGFLKGHFIYIEKEREEESMGLKIEKSGLPPMKVLISKKLHILRPAIEYMQLISNPKKVSLPMFLD